MSRLSAWWNSDFELDPAPWCRPKARTISESNTQRITVTTTYGYHVLAALLYAAWRKITRREGADPGGR